MDYAERTDGAKLYYAEQMGFWDDEVAPRRGDLGLETQVGDDDKEDGVLWFGSKGTERVGML